MRTLATENVLAGLRSVELLVEGASARSLPGLDDVSVRDAAERILESSPIRLLPAKSGGSILYLNLDVIPGNGQDLVAGLELQLLENVWQERDPKTRILAATWDEGVVLACQPEDITYVTTIANSLIARFVQSWRHANER